VDSHSHRSDEVARNITAVRRGWEAFNAKPVTLEGIGRGDLAPVFEEFDRGVVLDVTDLGIPGLGTYRGWRGLRQFWRDWFEVVGDVHTEVLEIRGAGDKVMSVCRQTGSGMVSGAMVTWQFANVFTMREGKVVRMEMYAESADARRMAGLAPTAVADSGPR
jgi:ketosteroid isomerase-like protein